MRRMNAAFLAALLSLATTPASVSADPLPGTQHLTDSRDLARVMVDGIHAYLDRELKEAPKKRDELWKAKANEPIAAKRERLKKILGVVDERLPRRMEYFGSRASSQVSPTPKDGPTVYRVRWDVLPGLQAEGLYIRGVAEKVTGWVVAIPDSSQSAEVLAYVSKKDGDDFAYRLAEEGCEVIVVSGLSRADTHSGNEKLKRFTNQSHREFVHRMAYEMGRTATGIEIQQVLAALPADAETPLGVIGFGDGGRVAMYAAAIDERIKVCHVAGAFGPQESSWKFPLDRNHWSLLNEFGDAEIGSMILPRQLIVDALPNPVWDGPSKSQPGRSGAAAGSLNRYSMDQIKTEFNRIQESKQEPSILTTPEARRNVVDVGCMEFALTRERRGLRSVPNSIRNVEGFNLNEADKPEIVQKRLLDRQVNFVQNLWRNSEPVRKEFWKKSDASSPEAWEKSCDWYREYFHDEIIGRLPKPTLPLNPKSRPIYDTQKWTGHEVTVDVYPDVMAYGILLLPKDLKPGEKRPVVVCQHGLEGRPTDVCNPKEKTKYYLSFGAQLADKGYIVFAPQNPYIFDDHFRQILRKANPLKLSLFSFIIRQHERILDWLETQPHVDPKRIAFYGLSYGGKTAMRVPAVEKRYCLSICSGDFNEWIGKIVSTELPMSYMYTKEYDMLEFNLGHTFNYAEMAYMIAPRPFMVERGHDDGVGTDEMVAYEYAKVRYLYANKLKIPDRTAIEFFPGGHQINGKGTFEFLQKHLQYPK
jgi:dienelactone hydrolase